MIEPKDEISVAHQCGLLDVARSSYYYEKAGESALNLDLMRLIDEPYELLRLLQHGAVAFIARLSNTAGGLFHRIGDDFAGAESLT